ncbi:MAG TPA: methyltransferase domain-containing protein [Thermoanaerobaculia bacterium]|nr:methyltransferase domain-containing protein [Thermoanaerobaculia bacterium]
MASDLAYILQSITSFYDFSDREVLYVGAGDGQLIDCAASARSVLAVDSDAKAVAALEDTIRKKGLADRVGARHAGFESIDVRVDVVFFEFCLHEIHDPTAMLDRALTMAGDVVIVDHLPESPWVWHTCETEMVERSWNAVHALHPVRIVEHCVDQRFPVYEELRSKIEVQGPEAVRRAGKFKEKHGIVIEMKYGLALISQ